MYYIKPFLYDIVNVSLQFSQCYLRWLQYELYWCRYEVKLDGH